MLVVAGEHDQAYVAHGRRLAAGSGRNAALAVIAGAGHACHLEQPDAFLAAVRASSPLPTGSRETAVRSRSRRPAGRRTPAAAVPVSPSTAMRPLTLLAGQDPADGTAASGRASRASRAPGRSTRDGRRATANGAITHADVEPPGGGGADPHRQGALAAGRVARDVAQVVDHQQRDRQQPDGDGGEAGQAGQAAELDVGRADRGHHAEEHEYEQLAEPRVAVGPRPAGVEPARGDDAAPTRISHHPAAAASARPTSPASPKDRPRRRGGPPRPRPGRTRPAGPARPGRRRYRGCRRCSRWRSWCPPEGPRTRLGRPRPATR